MAILNSIRKRGIFLIIIIALALFAFILSDILTSSSGPKGQDTAAVVNGTDISRLEFMEKVDAAQRNMGPNASTSQAINMVYEQEVRRLLMQEQYEKLGLTAESAQISNGLRTNLAGNQNFLNEAGQFDEAKMQQYIADVKATNPVAYQQWLEFEKNTEQNVLQNTYFTLVRAGLRNTLAEGEQAYRFENNKINIEFVNIPYSSIPDAEVEVTNDEIKKYIKDHPNDFKTEPKADIQYVLISEAPSETDINEAEGSVAALLNDTTEYNDVTKSTDTVYGFRNTKNYEEFVNANSDTGFDGRWVFKKDLPQEIAEPIFNLEEGAVYGPYKLPNGYGLSKVLDVKQMADTAKAKHILIRYQGSQTASPDITMSKEDARKKADSILNVVQKDKSKFEELAAKFSEDTSNKDKGGDLGAFTPGMMVPTFNDFVFDNTAGTIGVVETDFGFHVVSIEELNNTQKAMKIATVTKAVEPSEETLNEVFSKASNFEVAAGKGDFAEVAKEQNLEVRPVNKIGKLDENIPGIGSNRQIVNWAFNEDSSVGDVKRFSVPNGYVIAQITNRNNNKTMDVTEASAIVTPILRNKKKAEKIKANVTATTLPEIAAAQNVTVQTASAITMASPVLPGVGAEPKVVGVAFGKKAGETTNLISGDKGVFKVKVLSVEEAPKLQNYASFVNQLDAQITPAVTNNVYNAIKEGAEIEDNRADLF